MINFLGIVLTKIMLSLKATVDNLWQLLVSPIWTVYNIVADIVAIIKADVKSDDDEPETEQHHIRGFGKGN